MQFTIISSNIRFKTPKDGKHRWENRLPLLSEILNHHSPLVLGTQEGHRPQIKELEQELSHLTLVEQHRDWIEERMYPCLYINNEHIKLLHSGDFWLSETPDVPGSFSFDSAFPRLCTWMIISINDQEILIANTHLDHIKSSTRKGQIEVLINELKKINNDNLPLILMGDFNEAATHENRTYIMNEFPNLYDPWRKLKKEEEGSHHSFATKEEATTRIDWILIDKIFTTESIELDKSRDRNIWPSDHYPVVLTLDI